MTERLIDFLFRARAWVLAWLVTMTVLFGFASAELATDFDIEQFLPAKDPQRLYLEQFKSTFDVTDRDIMVIVTDESLFSVETLRDLQHLTGRLERIRGIEEVLSITNADDVTGSEDSLDVHPMVETIPDTPAAREALRNRILGNSLYAERLLSRDGRSTCLLAKIDWGYHAGQSHRADNVYGGRRVTDTIQDAAHERERIGGEVEKILAEFARPGRTFRLGGVPMVRRDYVALIVGDGTIFFPLCFLLLTLVLVVIFRNVSGVLITVAVLVSAVIWALGLMAMMGARMNFLANMMPVLVVIAGASDSLHIILHYYEEFGRCGDRALALRRTVRELAFACFLTSFTTALGFLTLVTTNITLIQEFGVYTGVGIVFAFVISILGIPVVLSWLPLPPPRAHREFATGWLAGLLGGLPAWVQRRRRGLVAATLLIVAVSIGAGSTLENEGRLLEDVSQQHPIIQTNHFIEDHFAGILAIEIVADSGRPDGVKDPGFLRRLKDFATFAAGLPEVKRTLSVVDFIEDLHESFRNEDPAWRRIPDSTDEVAQLLLLYSFSNQEPLKGFLSYDYRLARISVRVRDAGTRITMENVRRLKAYAATHFADLPPVRITGLAYLAQEVNAYIVENMATSFILDLLIISALFWITTANLRLALAGLIPNLVPLGATVLFMTLSGSTLKPSTAIIFSVVFGIAVDDSLHFLARFREEGRHTTDTLTAIARTLQGTGRATVFFSVMLTMGFSILAFSRFQGNQLFAILTGLTIMTGLAGELLLMPLCLLVLGARTSAAERSGATQNAANWESTAPEAEPAGPDGA